MVSPGMQALLGRDGGNGVVGKNRGRKGVGVSYESRVYLLPPFFPLFPRPDWLFRYFYCEGGLFEPSVFLRRIRYLVFQVLLL